MRVEPVYLSRSNQLKRSKSSPQRYNMPWLWISPPYQIIRHPIYASMFAMMIMSVLLLGRLPWWPIAIALFLTGIEIRIHAEDGLLRERFGSRFEDWKSKVPAYLPLLR